MSLLSIDPLRGYDVFSRSIRNWLGDDAADSKLAATFETGAYIPNVDIAEDADALYIIAELPGMKQSEVKITVHKNILSIRGEKKREEETKNKTIHRIERSFGEFVRQFRLTSDYRVNDIRAQFKDGLLEITVPKAQTTPVVEREITIESK